MPSASQSALPPTPSDRGKRLKEGARSIAKALWFVFSIVLYAIGVVFLQVGRALIKLSGWDSSYSKKRSNESNRPLGR